MADRWIIAQEAPGDPQHVRWALVDTQAQGVMGSLLGKDFAQQIADALNVLEMTSS
jgi:hypothetical protein